jgi:hypothetical protein
MLMNLEVLSRRADHNADAMDDHIQVAGLYHPHFLGGIDNFACQN